MYTNGTESVSLHTGPTLPIEEGSAGLWGGGASRVEVASAPLRPAYVRLRRTVGVFERSRNRPNPDCFSRFPRAPSENRERSGSCPSLGPRSEERRVGK